MRRGKASCGRALRTTSSLPMLMAVLACRGSSECDREPLAAINAVAADGEERPRLRALLVRQTVAVVSCVCFPEISFMTGSDASP